MSLGSVQSLVPAAAVLALLGSTPLAAQSQEVLVAVDPADGSIRLEDDSKCNVGALYIEVAMQLESASKFKRKRPLEGDQKIDAFWYWSESLTFNAGIDLQKQYGRSATVVPRGYKENALSISRAQVFSGVPDDVSDRQQTLLAALPGAVGKDWFVEAGADDPAYRAFETAGVELAGAWRLDGTNAVLSVEGCGNV